MMDRFSLKHIAEVIRKKSISYVLNDDLSFSCTNFRQLVSLCMSSVYICSGRAICFTEFHKDIIARRFRVHVFKFVFHIKARFLF